MQVVKNSECRYASVNGIRKELRIGWKIKRQTGSHKVLERPGWNHFVFAFHDNDEIGPRMLARIAKSTG
ncbi:MAG: type II toxin-antitoxin system HicA family toxin, partial [Microcystaceae cyanobacterium]